MNKEQLIKTLCVQSASHNQFRMFAFIVRQLKEIECDFYVDDGCIYITKGEALSYPCVVAHMDTVHSIVSDLTTIECDGYITGFNRRTMQQSGIGGDDKVGIFIAMECLRHFDNIKIVFFRDEEVGCEGSYRAYLDFFKDCSFVLQCDRQGNKDFVTNASGIALSSYQFQLDVYPILKRYGYVCERGFMTDVMALKENGLKCSAANISCGYYRPHNRDEYVSVRDVEKCLELVKDIIEELGHKSYPHKYKRKKTKLSNTKYNSKGFNSEEFYGKKGANARTYQDGWDYTYDDVDWETIAAKQTAGKKYCDCCGEPADELKWFSQYVMDLCKKCINEHLVTA